tara:strand:+ start:7478 stop:9523 length:2046 start_codon:yes stop_codon:yes gene_type:complete
MENLVNVVAIVQARMGSTRLPGKVMKKIGASPLIELIIRRLKKSQTITSIVVATSLAETDQAIVDFVSSIGIKVVRGSERDVLKRYLNAALESEADIIVRVTADCPLIDPVIVDEVVRTFFSQKVSYASNVNPRTFPDGLDVEVFSIDALIEADQEAVTSYDREHVTPYIRNHGQFAKASIEYPEDLSHYRWTVDQIIDFELVQAIFEQFAPNIHFSWQKVLNLSRTMPELFNVNQHLVHKHSDISTIEGQKLWEKAKQYIAGGNMLLSKKPDMFLPGKWPAYYSRAEGCRVWDLDGNVFKDLSIMGIGTNILGYSHPKINEAVLKAIQNSNCATLNCPEEVYLAEKMIEIHPWADMVRFARTGGEANAIAIRLARAASGRDQVAVCGYHGWHDWYLSANHSSGDQLKNHLLPGLNPKGVPQGLENTIFSFQYNDFAALKTLIDRENIGVIKMEVCRNKKPENNFLEKVRKLATDENIVLIFDECTSGFRETMGGLHLKYNVSPDMAIFGKALGNGHAITAVIGIDSIMQEANNTFISSTFWTERSGPVAALATLKEMERIKSWEIITNIGNKIKLNWQKLADKHILEIDQWGLPSLAGFTFLSSNQMIYKTYITQQLLQKGYLGANSIYACIAHDDTVLENYFQELDLLFGKIKRCEDGIDSPDDLLEGEVCESGFGRLN